MWGVFDDVKISGNDGRDMGNVTKEVESQSLSKKFEFILPRLQKADLFLATVAGSLWKLEAPKVCSQAHSRKKKLRRKL